MKHKLAGTAIAIGLLAACVSAQSAGQATGTVDGVVFTVDASGSHAVVSASRISLDGPIHIEAESDGAGKFAFNAVLPGAYTINAQAPGLATNRTIEVTAGSASEIALEMKVQAVVESTTVTVSTVQIDTKESPGTSTIGESAVRNMPNLDERIQSLLPLIPGVVRGPNGRINMKGAREPAEPFETSAQISVKIACIYQGAALSKDVHLFAPSAADQHAHIHGKP